MGTRRLGGPALGELGLPRLDHADGAGVPCEPVEDTGPATGAQARALLRVVKQLDDAGRER
jgi:hypothetical protein